MIAQVSGPPGDKARRLCTTSLGEMAAQMVRVAYPFGKYGGREKSALCPEGIKQRGDLGVVSLEK